MRGAELVGASRRVALLRALFLGLFLVLAARAAHLSVATTRGENRAKGQLEGVMVLPATRGLIVDRNGVELALTVHAPSVYVRPGDFDGNPESLAKLAKALGQKRSVLAKRLRGRKNFTYVGRWVSKDVARRIETLDLPGVGVISEPRREYPANELASSLLGFANIDGNGVRGIEQQEDSFLRGSPVRTPVERDARGHLMARAMVAPASSAGGDVALTIDMAMQAEAETALREAMAKTGAKGGCVITLDPRTGEILALAEAPGFNPNEFRKVKFSTTRSPSFQDAVESGSVMKAFLVAAALDAGAIGPNQRIDTGDGTLAVPGKTITDHHPYGVLDPAGVLQFSSNVGAVMIANRLGAERHYDALLRFGFGSKSGSGFPSESNGIMRHYKKWTELDHATVAYGQGLGVTAIQLTAAMGALAGDGQLRVPRLISARRPGGGKWEPVEVAVPTRVISPEAASKVLNMLESVVSAEGTGRKAGLSGMRVAGKTGTAQKLDTKRGVYSKTRYGAWFMGAAPADNPKLVIVAMLDEPKGMAHGGGDVAAPLFAKVAAGQLAHLGIVTRPEPIPAPRRPVMVAHAKPPKPAVVTKRVPARKKAMPKVKVAAVKKVQPKTALPAVSSPPPTRRPAPRSEAPVLMPDFRGETVASARQIASRDRIRIDVRGNGLAVDQHPLPGTVVFGSSKRVSISFSDGGFGG